MKDVLKRKALVESASIPENNTILQGIQRMNESNAQILLVTGPGGRLLGTVTDGDIRRGIYVGTPLSNRISDICCRECRYLTDYDPEAAIAIYERDRVRRIPVVDEEGVPCDLIIIEDVLLGEEISSSECKVVIMAGGRGSRLDPITRIVPKPLLPVGERPMLELIMDSFHKQGFNDFILSLNYKKDFIRSYFAERGELPYNIDFVEEETFMGTAGSLSLVKQDLHDTFFLTNCDILVEMDYRSAYRNHIRQKNSVTVVGVLKQLSIPYGVIQIENESFVGIDEKPNYHFIINAGIYILEPECIELIDVTKSSDGMFHMTDLMERAKEAGMTVGVYPAHRKWMDIGQWNEYSKLI